MSALPETGLPTTAVAHALNNPLEDPLNSVTTSPSGSKQPSPAPETVNRLDGLLDELASRREIHSAVMAVESLDHSFSWAGARGVADAEDSPMQEYTPFFIASIDKLITAVVILKLHEQGELELKAPISTYLPDDLVTGLHVINGQDRTGEITVMHLLSHTSGLASYVEDRPKGGSSLFESIVREKDRSVALEEAARIIREDLKPHFPPQPLEASLPRIRYSDTNFALLRERKSVVQDRAV